MGDKHLELDAVETENYAELRGQLLHVATAMAQGLLADPRMDWSSNKLAQYAVIYAKDLIHEVETTELD